MARFPITNKQITIPYLVKVGNGKSEKIGKYLIDKGMDTIALFWGEGMEAMVGDKIHSGLQMHGITVAHNQVVSTSDVDEIVHAAFSLSASVNAVVGVGGGKALDFAKYAAYLLRIPFISVPTSMSNDGFCSPTSSLVVQGKRKSIKSGIPFGIVIDLDIIKTNPKIFLYSGIGDMVSKITALWDWKEAFNKGLERFNDFSSLLAYNSLDLLFLKFSSDIYDPMFQRSLANSLLTSGIAMEVAGSSRPASGSEHLISHALDATLEKPKMHGIQVGVATYLCALLQGNENANDVRGILEKTGFLSFAQESPFEKESFLKAVEIAPLIKQNFYTILSEPESLERARAYVETDELLRSVIK